MKDVFYHLGKCYFASFNKFTGNQLGQPIQFSDHIFQKIFN